MCKHTYIYTHRSVHPHIYIIRTCSAPKLKFIILLVERVELVAAAVAAAHLNNRIVAVELIAYF